MRQEIQRAIAALYHEDSLKIWEAAKALVRLQANDVTTPLMDMAKAPGLLTRRCAAIWTLGFLRAYPAVQVLVKILRDDAEPPEVRAQAAESLGYLGDSKKAASIRPSVVKGLDDPNPDVVYWCAFALRTVGDASVVSKLRKLTTSTATTSTRESLAREAKEAIEQILLRRQGSSNKPRAKKTQRKKKKRSTAVTGITSEG